MASIHEFQQLAKAYSVLYIEDEEHIREETRKLLGKFFKRVRTASDGEEGLALYRQYHDDLVITDVNMPKLSGLEMTKKIRAFDRNVPIIIFSAYDDKANLLKAIDYGISQYVIKPLDIPIFILSLKKVLIQLQLEKKVERLNNRLWDILNTMDDLVVSYKNDQVTVANRQFLDFFGIDSIKELTRKPFDLSRVLLKEKSFTFADSWKELLEKLESGSEAIVKIYDKQHTLYRKFLIRFNHLHSNANEYMLTLTDISKVPQKSCSDEKLRLDPMTKVFNRTYLYKIIEYEGRHAAESGTPLSVIVLDIDRFKELNEQFGYSAGDALLVEFAALLKAQTKESMHLGRWSGNIFMVVAPGYSFADVTAFGESLQKTIASTRFETVGEVPCSLAATQYRESDTIDSLVVRAGEYIAKSKENGGGGLETDQTRTPAELEKEQEHREIVGLLKEIIEAEEKATVHTFYKGLPINGEAALLYIENSDNLAMTMKQNQAFVLGRNGETLITHPRLPLPVYAKVTSISIMEMVVTVSAFEYRRTSPIDRVLIRLETWERIEVTLAKGMKRISGQLQDISARSLAFHTFSLGDFKIRDDVIVEFDLPLDDKRTAHYKSMGKVIIVAEEGEYYKVVVLLFHSKQSEMVLQQYLATKQLALTQEILDFSI